MTLSLPVHVRVRRLPRGRCVICRLRRVLFTVQVELGPDEGLAVLRVGRLEQRGLPTEIEALATMAPVGLGAEPRCGECAGISEPS